MYPWWYSDKLTAGNVAVPTVSTGGWPSTFSSKIGSKEYGTISCTQYTNSCRAASHQNVKIGFVPLHCFCIFCKWRNYHANNSIISWIFFSSYLRPICITPMQTWSKNSDSRILPKKTISSFPLPVHQQFPWYHLLVFSCETSTISSSDDWRLVIRSP